VSSPSGDGEPAESESSGDEAASPKGDGGPPESESPAAESSGEGELAESASGAESAGDSEPVPVDASAAAEPEPAAQGDEAAPEPVPSAATAALRTIVIPDHDSAFWDDLGSQLADEPQLRLRPRAAVRPITQPPPIVDDRLPFDDGDLRPRGRSRKRHRRRTLLLAVVLSIAVIAGAAVMEGRDNRGDDVQAGGSTTTEAGQSPGSTASTAAPAPIDPAVPLTPDGVGPLTIGTPLRELQAQGAPAIVVDQPTFRGTGGTCFDATVTGVPDLVLRFRSPDPGAGISDSGDGVLATVAVDAQLGSVRATEAGVALGATEDQVRAAYPEDLTQSDDDYMPGAHVLTYVPEGTGNGIAFTTDGAAVTGITVGASDLIEFRESCPA
jgi:hypothetical protein